jgi:hypothetical protein
VSDLPAAVTQRALVLLSLAALLGCMDGTGPAEDVSGRWMASHVESSLTLDLVQTGTAVRGTGNSWGFILPPTHSYTIAGTYSRPSLSLTLTRDDSTLAFLHLRVRDATHMISVPTSGGSTDTLTFVKQ